MQSDRVEEDLVNNRRCDDCRHYRPALERNAPAQMLHWLTDSSEPEVYEELKQIAGEEYARKTAETERCTENRHAAMDLINDFLHEREWPLPKQPDFWNPPVLSDKEIEAFNQQVKPRLPMLFQREPQTVTHCAVHAERGAFYVADLRNWAATCGDYEKREVPRCRSCAFYVKNNFEAIQRASASSLVTAIGANDQSAASILERGASRIEAGIGPAKAHSLKTAYNVRGRLLEPLPYLPYCEALCPSCSDGEPRLSCLNCHGEKVQRAQPEIFNRLLGCQLYQPRDPAPVADAPGTVASTATAWPTGDALPISSPAVSAVVEFGNTPAPAQTAVTALGLSPFAASRGHAGGTGAHGAGINGLVEAFASEAVEFVFGKLREVGSSIARRAADAAELPADQLAIIAPGRPPLTNEMLRRSLAVASIVHPAGMAPDVQREYIASVNSVWTRNLHYGIRLQLALIQLYDDDRTAPAWKAEAARVHDEFVSWWRSAAEPAGSKQPGSQAKDVTCER
jgi:hypothetical protein